MSMVTIESEGDEKHITFKISKSGIEKAVLAGLVYYSVARGLSVEDALATCATYYAKKKSNGSVDEVVDAVAFPSHKENCQGSSEKHGENGKQNDG